MRTVAFCEIEPYCRAVLRKHWPDVPICADIRAMEAYRTAEAPGHGFIRGRSFAREGGGAVRRDTSINVGRSAPADSDAGSASRVAAQRPERNPPQEAGRTSALSVTSSQNNGGTSSSGEGSRPSVLRLQEGSDGHRSHNSSLARRTDGTLESATALPSMSPSEVPSGQEGGLNGIHADIGPIDVICGGFP